MAAKDYYNFELLDLADKHSEHETEQALIKKYHPFLLQIGSDFSFVCNLFKFQVSDKEYRIYLLLFHRKLQSLIATDLKIGELEPEHKGKMEFYLAVLNDTVKLPHENPAIGIIICKIKTGQLWNIHKRRQPCPLA